MVNRSREIKNPKTPVERKINEIKNSRDKYSTVHDAKTPVKTTIPVSIIMATEIPSTPILYSMFKLSNQTYECEKSISAVFPAFRSARYIKTSTTASNN